MAEQNKKTTVQAAGGFFKAVGNFLLSLELLL